MSKDPDGLSVRLVILGIIIVAGILLYPSWQRDNLQDKLDDLQEQYDDLEMKYDDLEMKYDDLRDSIGSLEDDIIEVNLYFENDLDASFYNSHTSFNRIRSVLYKIIYPEE